MSRDPRVVLGLPAYSRPDALPRAIESLISQTYQDCALVIVDDAPSAATAAIGETYAREYPQVTYEANSRRLGMVGNWRKVFERARERYPRAEYFAWVSDHDVWHARWLEELVAVLDREPEVVLAYPENVRITSDDVRITDKTFNTVGISDRAARIRLSARYMLSGDMVYGLVRANALAAAGVFRRVITPDRQVLLTLSLFGQVRQVREVLWYREALRVFDIRRQRQVFFPDGAPLYAFLPSHVQHCGTLLWDFAVRGRGRPDIGRLAGIRFAPIQLWYSVVRDLVAQRKTWRIRLARRRAGRWLLTWLPAPDIRGARRRASGQAAG